RVPRAGRTRCGREDAAPPSRSTTRVRGEGRSPPQGRGGRPPGPAGRSGTARRPPGIPGRRPRSRSARWRASPTAPSQDPAAGAAVAMLQAVSILTRSELKRRARRGQDDPVATPGPNEGTLSGETNRLAGTSKGLRENVSIARSPPRDPPMEVPPTEAAPAPTEAALRHD